MACSPPMALNNKYILVLTQTAKAISHIHNSFPDDCCALPKLIANPVSNKPPIINIIQLMLMLFFLSLFNVEKIVNYNNTSLTKPLLTKSTIGLHEKKFYS